MKKCAKRRRNKLKKVLERNNGNSEKTYKILGMNMKKRKGKGWEKQRK